MKCNFLLKRLFVLSALIVPVLLTAQENFRPMKDVEAFSEKMQTESQNTASIQSTFVQERQLAAMTQPLVSKGNFWYKKPASVRWEYVEPYTSLIIITKRKVFVKDDDKQQEYDMQSGSAFQNLGEIMFKFVLGDINAAEKDYKVDYQENNTMFFVKLTPRQAEQAAMSRIDLFFDKKDYSLNRIIMYESGEDFTSIRFENKQLNGQISNDIFKFR